MTAVLIVAHHGRSEAAALALAASTWLRERGHEAWLSPDDAAALALDALAAERSPADADLALSLGGDGTMLRTIKVLDGAEVPVIGINVGLLGYLTEIEPPAMTAALDRFLVGDFTLERRMMLSVSVDRVGEGVDGPWRALNEAVLEKQESGHTVRLLVDIDGAPFTSYAADGLIVATPTGSTAYSLSARGPVISPTHRALLLTPVSPHMLFDRALVLDPDEDVSIEVMGHRPVVLSLDGVKVAGLNEGDTVRCRPSDSSAIFVRFGPRRFHQILKAKFGLSDR
ncbi:MAG TPA: NAD(+)/NADH kinase [Ilumatobacteraceae bacterium]|jgi:NAD+ kinase